MGRRSWHNFARVGHDTDIGGDRFPLTRRSAIAAVRSEDQTERARALDIIVSAYWRPIYKYIRLKWGKSSEDAKDLTQGFFARAIEKDFFRPYDPAKARFRTFLRTCLDGFVANEDKAARRIKRGGKAQIMPLDFETAEGELKMIDLPDPESMDAYFEKEWARSFFSLTFEALRVECEAAGKAVHFNLFERYYLGDSGDDAKVTYEQLGEEFGLAVTSVTNYLAFARREFRRIALDKLRDITATDDEFRREARSLLGVEI
jgi:DNA-directed RNA polymerase specialized sigma24 family protein